MKTYRVLFSKKNELIFVSHLDFAHCIIRALKRAKLPLKYSEGFSPHPKIVFALPLSVGTTGENEIVDVTLDCDNISNEEFRERLSKSLDTILEIKKVYDPDVKLGKVKSAVYTVVFSDFSGEKESILKALENPPTVTKTTKSGKEKELDIKEMVYSYSVSETDGNTSIVLELASSGESYLNPELVLKSIEKAGVALPPDYDITRNEIRFEQ